jgi:hypothetical protein
VSPQIAVNTEVTRDELLDSISGEHRDWDEYRQAMVRQGKSLLRVTPARWSPVATGGFPPRLA